MRDVLEDLPSFGGEVGNYSDNVFGASPSEHRAIATLQALKARLTAHPLGPFTLKDDYVRHIDRGVELLSYHVTTVDREGDAYIARSFATKRSQDRYLNGQLRETLMSADPHQLDDLALRRGGAWVAGRKSWCISAEKETRFLDRALEVARDVREVRGIPPPCR